ncbi:oligosaccharide repeat unit polymerase [Acinetobacter indicus]|uniref:O-antigen polymerase n=1 Tax=Acinetobacter indicus TaxID=756892 RepID=UPI001FA79768|nr:O-antigen polymerase [Acinetobacter indicus]UNW09662.1 oligosaccharide repeat unit polymerase [Acinetobacter indicus]
MSLAYIFFMICSLSSLSILLLKKRYFDFISIYIIFLTLYSIPLFFNSIYNVYTEGFSIIPNSLTLISMGVAFFVTIPFLLMNNNFKINDNKDESLNYFLDRVFLNFTLICCIIGFLVNIPLLLNSGNKLEAIASTSIIYFILFMYFPLVGFFLAIHQKRNLSVIMFFIMLIVVALLGARAPMAMAIIGFLLYYNSNNKFRLISKYKFFLFGLASMFVIILSKTLYSTLYAGSSLGEWKNDFSLKYIFLGSEFLSTSTILDSVVVNDFSIDFINSFKSFLAILPIPLEYFNFSSSYFNDAFQPYLFPSISYGMAYNPWAEAYAWMGILGIVFYSLIILMALRILWFSYKRNNSVGAVLVLILAILIAFWIQRNSLGSILAYIRNILYLYLFLYICSFGLSVILSRGGKK